MIIIPFEVYSRETLVIAVNRTFTGYMSYDNQLSATLKKYFYLEVYTLDTIKKPLQSQILLALKILT